MKNSMAAKKKEIAKPKIDFSERREEMKKSCPLNLRLNVLFGMDFITMYLSPEEYDALPEEQKDEIHADAEKWAEEMTEKVIKEFKEWEIDGRPE